MKAGSVWIVERLTYSKRGPVWVPCDLGVLHRIKRSATDAMKYARGGASPSVYRVAEYRRVEKGEKA